ncbi:M16 family metallopeptidase [Leeuwenhoekiella marinoflava]|uniref:M16 family metallopeptidase n=1 Tax=Leeuwenhoekiella marinoflava TaxID=988 RepID=UPI003000FD99
MILRYSILWIYFLMCCIWPAIGQHNTIAEAPDTLELDPSVRYGKLKNGFTYYIRHTQEPENEVYFQMVVKAGNFHEDSLQVEYAHLLEHMGAKGTLHFPELRKYIQYLGGHRHAGTTDLSTWYWARLSTENQEFLKDGLQILRDWSQGIDLDPVSIDVERGAVLGEIRTANPYRDWLQEVTETTVEQRSGYQRKGKGKRADNIRNFNKDTFVRFYKEWYRPDLQAAIVVGDIHVDSVEMQIKRLFADLQKPEDPKDVSPAVLEHTIKLDGRNRYIVQADTVNPTPRLRVFSKSPNPGYSPKTQEDFKNLLVQKVYQELLLARDGNLNKQYRPLFTWTPSDQYADQQLYTMRISLNFHETKLPKMKMEFLKSLAAFRSMNSGFTEDELKHGKEMVRKMYPDNRFRNTKELAERYRDHFVLGTAAPAPDLKKQLITDLLDEIDLDDVHKAANKYGDLRSNTDFLFYAGPDISTPDSTMVWDWLSEVFTKKVEPYLPTPPVSSLREVVELPNVAPDAVRSITKNQIGVTTVDLANGVKLVLKPTGNSNFVKIRASRPNNVPFDNRREYLAAMLAPKAIQFAGAGPYTKFQLSDFMGGTDLQLLQRLDRTEQIIVGSSRADRMEDFLQLLYLYTQQPRMDQEAFQVWKNREQRWIKQGHPDKNMFFTSAIDQIRFPELPLPDAEDLDHLSMDSIYTAYHRWYNNFGGYSFVFTGDFDVNELLPVLVKYLSVLPKGNSSDSIVGEDLSIPLKKLNVIRQVNNSSESNVFLHFPVVASTDTRTKVLVSLLSNALYSRIWDRLRKGSYSPGARGDLVDFKNGIYNFQIWLDAETGKEDIMIRWALEEFRKLRENGVKEDWFEKNMDKRISNYANRFSNSAFWNDYLSEKVRNDEHMATEILEYETFLNYFITLEDLNKAAKELLSEKFLQKIVFLPKNTASTSELKAHSVEER